MVLLCNIARVIRHMLTHTYQVCDHCMAHGLICNEASVCEHCRIYGQPCIHRWCYRSPTSKDDCTNPRCHYAHMDAVPHTENEPKWIIFKGSLPERLSRGRLHTMSAVPLKEIPSDELRRTLDARQEDVVRMFYEGVQQKLRHMMDSSSSAFVVQ